MDEAQQGRAQALEMMEAEQGLNPQMRSPMSGANTEEVFVSKSLLPNVKEGQEVTGRFTVGKVGTKISLKPIEFLEEGLVEEPMAEVSGVEEGLRGFADAEGIEG